MDHPRANLRGATRKRRRYLSPIDGLRRVGRFKPLRMDVYAEHAVLCQKRKTGAPLTLISGLAIRMALRQAKDGGRSFRRLLYFFTACI